MDKYKITAYDNKEDEVFSFDIKANSEEVAIAVAERMIEPRVHKRTSKGLFGVTRYEAKLVNASDIEGEK